MKGATANARDDTRNIGEISIHAPNEGSDETIATEENKKKVISIHAPNEGSDPMY